MGRRSRARLGHARVEPEVTDELARPVKAADLADLGHERGGDDHVDAGDGHQPLDLRASERLGRDQALDRRDLCVQEVDLAQRRVDGLALLGGQLELGQPAPALGPEGLSKRGAAHQTAHQRRVDLVLGPRPGADQLDPAPQPPAHHLGLAVGHPHPIEFAGGQQPGQGAGVEPVGLRPRATDPRVVRRDHDHLGDMGLDDPPDRPRVASHLKRDPIGRGQAAREQLQLLGLGRDPPRRTDLTRLRDRHLAEIDVHVQRDVSHLLLLSIDTRENQWANDIDASAL